MKKNIFFVVLLAVSTFINAQKTPDKPISFGVKGGYTLSNMKVYDASFKSKSSFYVGVLAEYPLSPKLGIQGEIQYTQLGGKDLYPWYQVIGNQIVYMGEREYDYQINQIQVPVSLKYYFIPNLSVSAGINLGFTASTKIVVKDSMGNTYEEADNNDGIKKMMIFPFVSTEYKINKNIFVDARYNFNFFETSSPVNIGFFQAGLGYRFK
ncbi:porin family protein [Chryseobacterium sp. M5A1_1a]